MTKDKSRERHLSRGKSLRLSDGDNSPYAFKNPLDYLLKNEEGGSDFIDKNDPHLLEGITRKITKVSSKASSRAPARKEDEDAFAYE